MTDADTRRRTEFYDEESRQLMRRRREGFRPEEPNVRVWVRAVGAVLNEAAGGLSPEDFRQLLDWIAEDRGYVLRQVPPAQVPGDVRVEAASGVAEVLKSAIPGHVVLRASNGATGMQECIGVVLRADEARRVAQALLGGRLQEQSSEGDGGSHG